MTIQFRHDTRDEFLGMDLSMAVSLLADGMSAPGLTA